MTTPDDLRTLYESIEYPAVLDGREVVLRPGHACEALDQALRRRGLGAAAYVTAHDPGGVRASDAQNAAAQGRLRERLVGFEVVEAPGGWTPGAPDPSHAREPSLLVLGLPRADAIVLGRMFGQAAVVVHEVGARTQLVML